MPENVLYYGDNLDVLRRHVASESIDLVYLDPPFNSNADYNVLFAEKSGERAHAQIKAFEDTWEWDVEAARNFTDAVENGGPHVARAMLALKTLLGQSDMLAYLSMMAPRLVELRRVLKPTGSIYLHCDPTASHYLKLLMDSVFGAENFKSEIVWKRSSAHSDTKQGRAQHGRIHDVILFYAAGRVWTWNPQYTPYDSDYLEAEYRHKTADDRFYKETDCTAAKPGGDTEFEWRVKRAIGGGQRWQADLESEYLNPQDGMEYLGVRPYNGRFWAYSKENLAAFWRQGKLIHRETGMPRLMQFADEMPGVSLQDLWTDIPPELGAKSLGYPTQKPEVLLERIISASSNKGDVVLDPFCGCGTAIAAAQKLERRWVGIDITHLAIKLIKGRLADAFGERVADTYKVIGEPTDIDGARALAEQDKYQFQYWALGIAHPQARPEVRQQKKGADKGIDGRMNLVDAGGNVAEVIFSVKGGHVNVAQVRDLRGVIEREGAAIGVFICLEEVTGPMRREAADAGFFTPKVVGASKHPRLQILTIQELLDGKRIDLPAQTEVRSFKQAPKAKSKGHAQHALPFNAD